VATLLASFRSGKSAIVLLPIIKSPWLVSKVLEEEEEEEEEMRVEARGWKKASWEK